MRQPVPLELLIQIRMRIKMKNRQLPIPPRKRFHNRIGNRMIPAQTDRTLTLPNQPAHPGLNRRKRVLLRECQIPRVLVSPSPSQIDAQLGPRIRRVAAQRLANRCRSLPRSSQIRRLSIKRNAQKSWKICSRHRFDRSAGVPPSVASASSRSHPPVRLSITRFYSKPRAKFAMLEGRNVSKSH